MTFSGVPGFACYTDPSCPPWALGIFLLDFGTEFSSSVPSDSVWPKLEGCYSSLFFLSHPPPGRVGTVPVWELLTSPKKEAFVTGRRPSLSHIDTKVRPQHSWGLQSSASRSFLKGQFPFFGVIPSDRWWGFNSVQNGGLGALPRPSAPGLHPSPSWHYLMPRLGGRGGGPCKETGSEEGEIFFALSKEGNSHWTSQRGRSSSGMKSFTFAFSHMATEPGPVTRATWSLRVLGGPWGAQQSLFSHMYLSQLLPWACSVHHRHPCRAAQVLRLGHHGSEP